MLAEVIVRLIGWLYPTMVMDAWKESEHKRDKDGKFAATEGGCGSEANKSENIAELLKKAKESGIIEVGNLQIPIKKFTAYALDPLKAPDKARAFESALGYTQENADDLMANIVEHVSEKNFVERGDKGHGMRYECIVALTGANKKTANVLTAWIRDKDRLRLTSVYVTRREATT